MLSIKFTKSILKYISVLCSGFKLYMFSTEQTIWPKLPGKVLTENHILYEQDSNFQQSTGNLIKHTPLCHNLNYGKSRNTNYILSEAFKQHIGLLQLITSLFLTNSYVYQMQGMPC
jgi:hypothetical protein